MAELGYELSSGTLSLSGDLNVETVSEYHGIGLEALDSCDSGLQVDLVDAKITGSAAIALLISWQRHSNQLGKSFSIVNAPQHFLDIAKVSGVVDILPFA